MIHLKVRIWTRLCAHMSLTRCVAQDSQDSVSKTTRFAEGTNSEKTGRPVLARDHSLGREYIEPGDAVTLEGFSWQEPLPQVYPGRMGSQGSYQDGPYYPPGRMNSQGSMGVPHPNYHQSHGSAYPDYQDRQSHYASSGRYESWGQPMSSMGSAGPMPPPPMPGYGDPYQIQRSGSWGPPMGRDNSLSYNPLRDATTSHPAAPNAFDSGRAGSGYWADAPPIPHRGGGGPPYPPQDSFHRRSSSGNAPSTRSPPRGTLSYSVDPSIAKTWSSQSDDYDKVASMMGNGVPHSYSDDGCNRHQRPHPGPRYGGDYGGAHSPLSSSGRAPDGSQLARPTIVKRHTSNQNENAETKKDLRGPSVKRAALNRDNSLASNRLKAAYLNDTMNKLDIFDSDKEMRNLSGTLEQATLEGSGGPYTFRPKPLSASERMSSVDKIAMDLMIGPEPLGLSRSRSSTIEALALDFDDDPVLRPGLEKYSSVDSLFNAEMEKDPLAKPAGLTADARITTMDFLDMIRAPLERDDSMGLDRPLALSREVSVSEWLNDV